MGRRFARLDVETEVDRLPLRECAAERTSVVSRRQSTPARSLRMRHSLQSEKPSRTGSWGEEKKRKEGGGGHGVSVTDQKQGERESVYKHVVVNQLDTPSADALPQSCAATSLSLWFGTL